MATQNLLQRLDAAADTTGSSVNASDRRIEEVFIASEAIAAGDFVTLDLSKSDDSDKALHVKKLNSGATITSLCVGVAIAAAAAAGDNIRICVRGMISANVATGVAQADRLVASSTGGRAEVAPEFLTVTGGAGAGTKVQQQHIVAIAVSAESGNAATVYVLPNF
jgi:hypothetical protein|tara:strand:- start:1379 stop:1873 length:495 start_codon:yes stop_codon:yes gene_type:complete